ncbi:MAG TPA: hypothetical protein VIO14_13410 [Dehalococcoidia bacterium]
MPGTVLALVPDLMFGLRIQEAAKQAGARVEFFQHLEDAALRLSAETVDLILVDLGEGTFDVDAVAELGRLNGVPVVAFGPHVDVAGRRAAVAAGVDRVLTRQQFVRDLPDLIARYVH